MLRWAALILIASTTTATAQKLPDLNPVQLCKRSASMLDQGSWMINACLEQEQTAYNDLKATWPTVDKKTRRMCTRQSKMIGQGYWMLKVCVDQEIASKEKVDKFKFKK